MTPNDLYNRSLPKWLSKIGHLEFGRLHFIGQNAVN